MLYISLLLSFVPVFYHSDIALLQPSAAGAPTPRTSITSSIVSGLPRCA